MKQPSLFTDYIPAFEKQLRTIHVAKVSPERYIKNYLSHLVQHATYYLAIYADVLTKLLQHSSVNKEAMVLVDVGAGNGLLGIFAKYCGFKKVFLHDIDSKFIAAAQQLASQFNITMDGFAAGELDQIVVLPAYEKPDAAIGTDVIEHIYSLPVFFGSLHRLNPLMVTVLTTAANPENYLKVQALKKLQVKDELYGAKPGDETGLGRSSPAPFIKIREELILRHMDAPDRIITDLAQRTRGLNVDDIIAVVKQYRRDKTLPPLPDHPTNTCDPLNGSWTERILSLETYRSIYGEAGFGLVFYNGFFNEKGSILKKMLNRLIPIAGSRIAPYITLVGIGKGK